VSIIHDIVRKSKKDAGFTLQLTAMVDMFTIMIVFLLKSYDTSSLEVKNVDGLILPASITASTPKESMLLLVSKKGIFVNDTKVAAIENGKVAPKDISTSDEDYIEGLFKELDKEAKKVEELSKKNPNIKFDGKILMQADKELDYGVLRKILYTATMAGYGDLRLAALDGGGWWVVIALFITIFSLNSVFGADQIESLKVSEKDIESGKSEKKLLATEVLVSQSEEKALLHIKNLIKKYKGTSMEPGLIYRLAELYMNRAKTARFVEQIKGEQGALSFLPSEVKSLQEKNMIKNAVEKYSEIERRFKNYPELDQVLFNMAFAYLQIGDDVSSEKAFIRLIKSRSRSKMIPDAFLAVGEINFKRRDFRRALAFYSRVKKYKKSKVYPYGVYKGAWCYYNLKGYEQAIADLETVK